MRELLKFFTLISLFLILGSNQVYAQAGGPTSCDSKTYCENGRWIKKSGCVLTDAAEKERKACDGDEDCLAKVGKNTNICICDFQQLSGTCDTQGGINEGADSIKSVFGKVDPPAEIARLGFGEKGIANILQVIIRLIYIVGAIAFVMLFLFSAVQLIFSGGDKEAVGKARSRITWAIIGLALLSFAFVIFRILESIIGFKLIA